MKKLPTKVTAIHPSQSRGARTYPLYASQPAAGFPAPGDDMVEKPLDLNDILVENPTATFFVRVRGDSMEGAGIFDKDILVVDRSVDPADGRIVVAAVYGELVVKRLRIQQQTVTLESEHPEYTPIIVSESDDIFIWGVVVGSVRQFS